MAFDNNSYDETNYESTPTADGDGDLPEEASNNRTFMIAVGILGGLILISVACLAAVWLLNPLRSMEANTSPEAQAQSANATQTEIANQIKIQQALTATSQAALPTPTLSPTPTSTPPVAPPSPTNTLDPAATASGSGATTGLSGTQVAATSTVAAALTKASEAQAAITSLPTVTPSMPNSGIADEYGLPGLVVATLAFIIVILFARRLRSSPAAR